MTTPAVPADTTPASPAAGEIAHIGLFVVPALVVLAAGAVTLWREQQ